MIRLSQAKKIALRLGRQYERGDADLTLAYSLLDQLKAEPPTHRDLIAEGRELINKRQFTTKEAVSLIRRLCNALENCR